MAWMVRGLCWWYGIKITIDNTGRGLHSSTFQLKLSRF